MTWDEAASAVKKQALVEKIAQNQAWQELFSSTTPRLFAESRVRGSKGLQPTHASGR